MARETVSRAKARSTSVAITVSLVLVGGVAITMFSRAGSIPVAARGAAMATAAYQTAAFQMALILLVGAALAAGAIAGEREGKTFDMLLVSELSAWTIVQAKLLAGVSYLLQLVVAAAPLFVAIFLHAGLTLGQLLLVEVVTMLTAVSVIALGILLSAICPRRATATLAVYSLVLALAVETLASGLIPPGGAVTTAPGSSSIAAAAVVHPARLANPWYAVHQIVAATGSPGVPVGQMAMALIGGSRASSWGPRVQPWQASVVVQLLISALLCAVAARLVSGDGLPAVRRGRGAVR